MAFKDTRVAHKGRNLTLETWAYIMQIPYKTLEMRYKRGKRGDALFVVNRMYTFR